MKFADALYLRTGIELGQRSWVWFAHAPYACYAEWAVYLPQQGKMAHGRSYPRAWRGWAPTGAMWAEALENALQQVGLSLTDEELLMLLLEAPPW